MNSIHEPLNGSQTKQNNFKFIVLGTGSLILTVGLILFTNSST